VTADCLTAILAEKVMGWRVGPERFLTGGRCWIRRSRFQPTRRMEDALQLQNKAGGSYSITKGEGGTVTAKVTLTGKTRTVTDKSDAAALTRALALALGIPVEETQ
jgi:hypothetical protein